jgi:sugar lactone lactonase YvrE
MMPEVRVVADGFSYLECPRWHDGQLFVSDFYTHRVVAVAESGAVRTVAEVPQQPSGLGWLPDGRLLVVSMRDRKVLRRLAPQRHVGRCRRPGLRG